MSTITPERLCPARPTEVKILGRNLVDQLLKVENRLSGPEQFRAKQEIIAHFEKNEPDLFHFFKSRVISPFQLLVAVQRAFENQSDVTFADCIVSKSDAAIMLMRYIPNLQYLHENQLYTNADTFKELGASMAIGVAATGITEAVGRQFVSNPFLSMEMALTETLGIGLVCFLGFVGFRNRSIFHKAPWNSAIYLGANLHATDPEKWESATWKHIQEPLKPSQGFTFLKTRPHYEELDTAYSGQEALSSVDPA